MNSLPEFHNFLAELETLIRKYKGSDPRLLTKDQRISFAARQTLPLYRKQFAQITDFIAAALELDAGLIDQSQARCRFARVAWARHICMMFCDEFTDAAQSAIAAYYGCPSHGGVGYARRNVEASCSVNKQEAAFIARMRLGLKELLATTAAVHEEQEKLVLIKGSNVGPAEHAKGTRKR